MEHISVKEIGQIIKQNRFWLGIIGLLDLFSILLLWLIDAKAFYVIAISVTSSVRIDPSAHAIPD